MRVQLQIALHVKWQLGLQLQILKKTGIGR